MKRLNWEGALPQRAARQHTRPGLALCRLPCQQGTRGTGNRCDPGRNGGSQSGSDVAPVSQRQELGVGAGHIPRTAPVHEARRRKRVGGIPRAESGRNTLSRMIPAFAGRRTPIRNASLTNLPSACPPTEQAVHPANANKQVGADSRQG